MGHDFRNSASAKHHVIVILAGLVWAATVVHGGNVLWTYKTTPSAGAEAPTFWPSAAPVRFDPSRANLVLLAHPQCPCTRASIVELNNLAATLRDKLAIHVFFLRPAEFEEEWVRSASWNSARQIPGAAVRIDDEGRTAARFGAVTSGQAVLYGRDGRLLFSGGLTAVRGHVGEGAGIDRIVSLVTTGKADSPESFVFGCSLVTPNTPQQGGTL